MLSEVTESFLSGVRSKYRGEQLEADFDGMVEWINEKGKTFDDGKHLENFMRKWLERSSSNGVLQDRPQNEWEESFYRHFMETYVYDIAIMTTIADNKEGLYMEGDERKPEIAKNLPNKKRIFELTGVKLVD